MPAWAAVMTTLARTLAPTLLAQEADPLGTLGSVGVVGAIAVLALIALQVIYKAQIATLRETVATERARADRYEAEVRDLNAAIRGQVLTALTEATTTQREAIQAMRKGTLT
jgi:hypothetical protein